MSESELCWYLGFRTKLDPTKEQAEYFSRASGTARLVFNWGLGHWIKQYEEYKNGLRSSPPNIKDIKKQLTQLKKEGEKFFWMKKVTKCAPQYALTDLGMAFEHLFDNPGDFKYPNFKRKGPSETAFAWITVNLKLRTIASAFPMSVGSGCMSVCGSGALNCFGRLSRDRRTVGT